MSPQERIDALRIVIAKHRDELVTFDNEYIRATGDCPCCGMPDNSRGEMDHDQDEAGCCGFVTWIRELDEALAVDDAAAGGTVAQGGAAGGVADHAVYFTKTDIGESLGMGVSAAETPPPLDPDNQDLRGWMPGASGPPGGAT